MYKNICKIQKDINQDNMQLYKITVFYNCNTIVLQKGQSNSIIIWQVT